MAEVEAAALMAALEQAALMAKQLANPSANTISEQFQIYSSLHAAHHQLSQFLLNHPSPSFLPTPPPASLARENSVSSAVGGGGGGDDAEPMQTGDEDDDDDVEYNSKSTGSAMAAGIDGVEEKMKDCYIQNKRHKRSLSPSVVAEQRRSYANEVAARVGYSTEEFDPEGNKLRSLDLIYQFHG